HRLRSPPSASASLPRPALTWAPPDARGHRHLAAPLGSQAGLLGRGRVLIWGRLAHGRPVSASLLPQHRGEAKVGIFLCLRESPQHFSRSLPYRISPWHQAWKEKGPS
ncbi:unnamed protein product, partial [Musa acuminata subsp. burmannicoides]